MIQIFLTKKLLVNSGKELPSQGSLIVPAITTRGKPNFFVFHFPISKKREKIAPQFLENDVATKT